MYLKQKGMTLVEALASLAIAASVMYGASQLGNTWLSDTKATIAAQHLRTVGEGAKGYIKDNLAAITAQATATVPVVIPVSALAASGTYLSSGYQSTNGYGQTTCVLVLQPSANVLQAMVVTTGGTAIDDITLGEIAGIVGAPGGGIYSTSNSQFSGTQGGWSVGVGNFANANKLCADGATAGTVSLAAGHPAMALWYDNGQLVTDFLYRNAVNGRPDLNTMNTPIIMASVQTSGNSCTPPGAIAADSNGGVLSCQGPSGSATWQSQGSAYWKNPVANYGSLPTCNAASIWQTRVVQSPTIGSGPRAFTCDGTSYKPLGVGDSGNLHVPGAVAAGGIGVLTTTATGSVGSACTAGAVAQASTGQIIYCNTNTNTYVAAPAGVLTANSIQIAGIANEGYTCAGNVNGGAPTAADLAMNGRVARDANGLILSCQSGVWSPQRSLGGSYLVSNAGCNMANPKTGALSCPPGYVSTWAYVSMGPNVCSGANDQSTLYLCVR